MGKKSGYDQKNFEFKNEKIIHVAQEKTQQYHKIWLGFMDEDGLSSTTFHGLKTLSQPPNPFSQFEYYSNGVFVDESNMNHDLDLTEEYLVHYVLNDWLPDEGLEGSRRENVLSDTVSQFLKESMLTDNDGSDYFAFMDLIDHFFQEGFSQKIRPQNLEVGVEGFDRVVIVCTCGQCNG